jgi:hypothetical protein
MNKEQKQIIKQWREVNNQYMDNKRYEEKAALQDSNKARMYEEKKKQDKLKKYSVTVSKTISVLASDEYEAEEQARTDFDCTDLDCEVNDE